MDCIVHGVAKSWTQLSDFHCHLVMHAAAAAAAKSLQSCPTLCDPRDSSPPGSAILGILQARTLEWVAISFSNAGKWKVKVKSLSRVRLLATPWTAAYQAPLSMGFSRQEMWCHCHCLLLGYAYDCIIQKYIWCKKKTHMICVYNIDGLYNDV